MIIVLRSHSKAVVSLWPLCHFTGLQYKTLAARFSLFEISYRTEIIIIIIIIIKLFNVGEKYNSHNN